MDDFHQVASKLSRISVTAPDFGNSHGFLSLSGNDSTIELTGNIPITSLPSPDWFNLRLHDTNGKELYIHNAICTSWSVPSKGSSRTAVIFPNIVVDDAAVLDVGGRCSSIIFELDGWDSCFAYNYIEWLGEFRGSRDPLLAELEDCRFESMRDKPFSPIQVHVVNNLGHIANFEVGGRRYLLNAGSQQRMSNPNRIDIEVRLKGMIIFPEPVDLDTAIDACWDWRRYFNQLAMSALSFKGMAVGSASKTRPRYGNLYLSNNEIAFSRKPKRRANSRHMPLNRWEDREQAERAMKKWLESQEERKFFRAALDRVIARPGHVPIEDAVALCAGLDSLTELSSRENLSRQTLDAMTQAALEAATANGIQLDPLRIRGLLGSIQNDDLRRRLTRLATLAAPEMKSETLSRWIEIILPLRVLGAHGRSPSTDQDLIAGPAVSALAALCARFDLQDSGVPDKCPNGARSQPKLDWDKAMYSFESAD